MSITTKRGDDGTTGLMYNRRVSKCHPRVEAYACVDELNAALGQARALAPSGFLAENLLAVQKNLVALMGELATDPADLERYTRDGYPRLEPAMTEKLDALVVELEARPIEFSGWATPGANPPSAALDVARTVCRRAERRVCALRESNQLGNDAILVYLNRLSDVLWLFARWAEKPEGT